MIEQVFRESQPVWFKISYYRDEAVVRSSKHWGLGKVRICKIEYHLTSPVLTLRREGHERKRQSQIIASWNLKDRDLYWMYYLPVER